MLPMPYGGKTNAFSLNVNRKIVIAFESFEMVTGFLLLGQIK